MSETKLMLGDNIESLKKLPNNSVDSVVTDPPYGLSFMNKKWDYDVPSVDFWKEVYRVLKPGGHVLSFGGTRTYHRMAVNIEDAGFEIRDQIMWLYSSGFPKSLNIGKAVDSTIKTGKSNPKAINQSEMSKTDGEVVNVIQPNNGILGEKKLITKNIGASLETEQAQQWEGWGTALKPANEPICVARKPLSEKSVALNALKWGTGGINIDDCRVGSDIIKRSEASCVPSLFQFNTNPDYKPDETPGRWPANVILECCCDKVIEGERGEVKKTTRIHNYEVGGDKFGGFNKKITGIDNYNDTGDIHTDPMCPCYMLDQQSGLVNQGHWPKGSTKGFGEFGGGSSTYEGVGPKDKTKSGASRFFYQSKVSKAERNMGLDEFEDKKSQLNSGGIGRKISVEKRLEENGENAATTKNTHPTVKPVNLMAYLCRLVTPPNGIVLDPFMGSGSTGIASRLEGFTFYGMELDENYFKIAESRIDNYEKYSKFKK